MKLLPLIFAGAIFAVAAEANAQARTRLGCIVGEERWDASVGRCRPVSRDAPQLVPPTVAPLPPMPPSAAPQAQTSSPDQQFADLLKRCTSGVSAPDRIASCSEIINAYDSVRRPDASDGEVVALALAWRGTTQLYQGLDRFAAAVSPRGEEVL